MKKIIILLFTIALSLAVLEIGVSYISMDSKDIPTVKVDEIRFTEKVSEYSTISSIKAIDENDPTNKLFNSIYQKSYSQNSGISWSYNKYLRKVIFMTLNSIIITNDIQELGYMGYLNPSYFNNITLAKERDELDKKSLNENISLEERNNAHIEYEKKAQLAHTYVYTKSSKAISSNVASMSIIQSNLFPEYITFSKFNFRSTTTNTNIFDTSTISYLVLSDMLGSPGIVLFNEEPFILPFRNTTFTQKERKEETIAILKGNIQKSLAYDEIEFGTAQEDIFYASYYPYYKKMLVIVKIKDENALKEAQIFIDNKKYQTEIGYPMIIVDSVDLNEGEHKLTLKIRNKEYTTPIQIQYPPFKGGGYTSIQYQNIILLNLYNANSNITNTEKIRITNSKLNINCILDKKINTPPFEFSEQINVSCPDLNKLEKDKSYMYNISIDYSDNENNTKTALGTMKTYLQ